MPGYPITLTLNRALVPRVPASSAQFFPGPYWRSSYRGVPSVRTTATKTFRRDARICILNQYHAIVLFEIDRQETIERSISKKRLIPKGLCHAFSVYWFTMRLQPDYMQYTYMSGLITDLNYNPVPAPNCIHARSMKPRTERTKHDYLRRRRHLLVAAGLKVNFAFFFPKNNLLFGWLFGALLVWLDDGPAGPFILVPLSWLVWLVKRCCKTCQSIRYINKIFNVRNWMTSWCVSSPYIPIYVKAIMVAKLS
jgi:hypothetical protein